MTEKDLIAKIQGLKQIKPDQNWVIFAKNAILKGKMGEVGVGGGIEVAVGKDPVFVGLSFGDFVKGLLRGESFVFQHKLAFSGAFVVVLFVGLFGLAQISLPGDILFSLKKATEEGQSVFVPQSGEIKYNIELVNRRLDELTKIAKNNTIKNLASAINELQASVSKAAESLAKPGSSSKYAVKDIAVDVKNIEKKVEEVKSLGVEVGGNKELDGALAVIVENEIKDLENQSLSEEGQSALNEIKADYEARNYSSALEKILLFPQLTEQ